MGADSMQNFDAEKTKEEVINKKVVQVIEETVLKGCGDQQRVLKRYYDLDGVMICDTDACFNSVRAHASLNLVDRFADSIRALMSK